MHHSLVDSILKTQALKNEKRVATIRMILAYLGIVDFIDYFGIIDIYPSAPTFAAIITSTFFIVYSTGIGVLLKKDFYSERLIYLIILLDYSYVFFSFVFDANLTADLTSIVWYAFAGVLIFYLINLLRYSRSGTIIAGTLSIVVFYTLNFYFGVPASIIFQVSIPLFLILLIGYSITISNKKMMVEANAKKMMERYLPPQLINDLYSSEANLEPGGKSAYVTILFSDIRGFTSISESLPAQDVVSLLNEYLSLMTTVIFDNRGTIDKFIGDAIMTIFGAPIKAKDDAVRAVTTAVQMTRALKEFNQTNSILQTPLKIGIGIHTGDVIAGNIGSEMRLDYTVIGDNVNLSSRIEQLTAYYGCPILISESTQSEIMKSEAKKTFCIREIDRVVVKGKLKGSKIFEVMAFESETEKIPLEEKKLIFEAGLSLYHAKKFELALGQFNRLEGDSPAKIYIVRCEAFLKNPPDDSWDGTHVMTSK
ncbi:MAG: adenylate/guanylate cyclase domain-containing protein [SAR324 cluster bacterium]|nr:adenylate/guanylate cyclase domain-containing protein [SAR324 cluster bacterium]